MRELYAKVTGILNRVAFDDIWRGFSKCTFAIYDKTNVYFHDKAISYDRRFLGNTCIEYNGEYIAIWNVENPFLNDPEILAADLVHEMFHAFQQKNHESRFPSDLLLLDYPTDMENCAVKHSENLLLVKAIVADDVQAKKILISQFISARKYREGLIGDTIKQEYLSETIEGMAEYAGSMALRQISPPKYEKRVGEYVKNLRALDNSFFDIRKISYYSGALFCITLSEAGKDFYHIIGDTELPLFSIAAGTTKPEKPPVEYDVNLLSTEIGHFLNEKKRKFEEFLLSHHEEIVGSFVICGYDPMNMLKMDDMILCSHFIMLKSEENEAPIFIQGPVLVNVKIGSINEVRSYIK